jgi:hypothetical protein
VKEETHQQEGGSVMVRFYDPRDGNDQLRVERLLRQGGVEYFLGRATEAGLSEQIMVAEEDVPCAEQLLQRH